MKYLIPLTDFHNVLLEKRHTLQQIEYLHKIQNRYNKSIFAIKNKNTQQNMAWFAADDLNAVVVASIIHLFCNRL